MILLAEDTLRTIGEGIAVPEVQGGQPHGIRQ
jgi:hypothetical protein